LFRKETPTKDTMIGLFADDLLVISRCKADLARLVKQMQQRFEMQRLRSLEHCLNIIMDPDVDLLLRF
jgi:hypothetical protein